MTALRKPQAEASARLPHAPSPPRSIAETGLEPGFLVDLLVKTIYRMGLERPSEIGREMKLPVGIVIKLIEAAQSTKLMQTLGQLGASMTAEMRYALTGKGREWALESLAQSEWIGPAPVTLRSYSDQMITQSIRRETLTRPMLAQVFAELTQRLHQLGGLRRLDQLDDDPDRKLHLAADLARLLQTHPVDRLDQQIDQKARLQPGLGDRAWRRRGMGQTRRSLRLRFAQSGHSAPHRAES
ncbi:MAG: hypothetical protein ACU0B1_12890, partial [Thermohalobaculum sp.]